MKHIKPYFEKINESIRPGSVILIKGAKIDGKTKLFAAHVKGVHEIKEGAQMLFLSDDFYRIKKDGDQYKSVKISYKSDESLKTVLNLKTPGKISIIKNNNKTPLHWKTLKYMTVSSALADIQGELEDTQYLLESVDTNREDLDRAWEECFNIVATKTLDTVFLGKRNIEILSYRVTRYSSQYIIELTVFDKTDDLDKFESFFDEPINPIDVEIILEYSTNYSNEIYDISIADILVGDGDASHSRELFDSINEIDKRLTKVDDLVEYVDRTIQLPKYKKREL